MTDRPSISRQVALLAVAVAGTLALLGGGWALGRTGSSSGPATASRSVVVATPGGASIGAAPGSSSPLVTPGPARSDGPDPTLVLTGAGDIGDCATSGARQASDLLVGQAGWFFTAGDSVEAPPATAGVQVTPDPGAIVACYGPTWGRVLDRTLLTTAGEGDWADGTAAAYTGYFGTRAAPAGVTWSSRDVGAWHVIVLDSDCARVGGCGPDSPQGVWLADDLARAQARCTLAVWHRPRFSSGASGGDGELATFWTLLGAAGADLIVNGHDHVYERFAPQDPGGREQRPGGIREIVVGTGGAPLGQFGRTAANSEFRLAGTWGVLRLTLRRFNYDWEFLPTVGEIADSGSTPCH